MLLFNFWVTELWGGRGPEEAIAHRDAKSVL